ncbi:unnamed protein product [Paramecium octaurelia]|uniref:Uncharacterized protein n=1 Tax=Paramecium octaurelia TaxID=43137 RepID=A0A8S1VXI5_PAROT|nr:unnamed protein product [Paramecium octaurelia]
MKLTLKINFKFQRQVLSEEFFGWQKSKDISYFFKPIINNQIRKKQNNNVI